MTFVNGQSSTAVNYLISSKGRNICCGSKGFIPAESHVTVRRRLFNVISFSLFICFSVRSKENIKVAKAQLQNNRNFWLFFSSLNQVFLYAVIQIQLQDQVLFDNVIIYFNICWDKVRAVHSRSHETLASFVPKIGRQREKEEILMIMVTKWHFKN